MRLLIAEDEPDLAEALAAYEYSASGFSLPPQKKTFCNKIVYSIHFLDLPL